jgi:hypothetical protein
MHMLSLIFALDDLYFYRFLDLSSTSFFHLLHSLSFWRMPKAKKRKTPVTSASTIASTSTAAPSKNESAKPASKHTRSTIRRFHVLLKRQRQLADPSDSRDHSTKGDAPSEHGVHNGSVKWKGKQRADPNMSFEQLVREREQQAIQEEIDALGGLAEYQRMSAAGQSSERGGSSAKLLVEWLKGRGMDKPEKGREEEVEGGQDRIWCVVQFIVKSTKPTLTFPCNSVCLMSEHFDQTTTHGGKNGLTPRPWISALVHPGS